MRGVGNFFRIALIAIVIVAAIVFTFYNSGQVALNFGAFGVWNLPLALALFSAFALGAVAGILWLGFGYSKKHFVLSRAEKRIRELEAELAARSSTPPVV